jgi:hypothetical protein
VKLPVVKQLPLNLFFSIRCYQRYGITPQTPKLFTELVHILKELNSQDLNDVYEQSQVESFCIDNSERVMLVYITFLLTCFSQIVYKC